MSITAPPPPQLQRARLICNRRKQSAAVRPTDANVCGEEPLLERCAGRREAERQPMRDAVGHSDIAAHELWTADGRPWRHTRETLGLQRKSSGHRPSVRIDCRSDRLPQVRRASGRSARPSLILSTESDSVDQKITCRLAVSSVRWISRCQKLPSSPRSGACSARIWLASPKG